MKIIDYKFIHELGNKKKQEDFIWPDPTTISENSNCFIVCDGVGGSENGDIASKFIAEYIGSNIRESDFHLLSIEFINELIQKARQELIKKADQLHLAYDMATTLAMIIFVNENVFISWCGDSRIYHIRNGNILYRSVDHSLVQLLVVKGEITEAEARAHPQKNVITKAIKADHPQINAEGEWIYGIEQGDYFMLCSDGLLEMISDYEINEIFSSQVNDPGKIRIEIYNRCLNKTRDNYSMSLIRVGNEKKRVRKDSTMKFLLPFLLLTAIVVTFIFFPSEKPKPEIRHLADPVKTDKLLKTPIVPEVVPNKNPEQELEKSNLHYDLIKGDDGSIDTVWSKPSNRSLHTDTIIRQTP